MGQGTVTGGSLEGTREEGPGLGVSPPRPLLSASTDLSILHFLLFSICRRAPERVGPILAGGRHAVSPLGIGAQPTQAPQIH